MLDVPGCFGNGAALIPNVVSMTSVSQPGNTRQTSTLRSTVPRTAPILARVTAATEPRQPKTNRLPAYLGQLQDYWFHGPQRRFARDAGVSESTLSRLLRGETNPRYADICKIVALLEQKLGRRIDPRDVYEP